MDGHTWRRSISALALLLAAPLCLLLVIGAGVSADRDGQAGKASTEQQYFDFSTRRSTTIAPNLGAVGHGLTVSRDGRSIFFARIDSAIDELMLVDDFR